jgi:hypothetical protein
MNEIIEAFFDELQKIATGLAPAGAPTPGGKGAGLAPKMPSIGRAAAATKPGGAAGALGGGMPPTMFGRQ